MSKLSKFLGKTEDVVINGETFKCTPLKIKDLELFNEGMNKSEQAKASIEMIKRSFPSEEFTDEELNSLDIETFTKLMTAINKLNGFNEQNDGIRTVKEKVIQ